MVQHCHLEFVELADCTFNKNVPSFAKFDGFGGFLTK